MDTNKEEINIPKWDVALSALLGETFKNKKNGLQIEDIKRLALEYAIRFDDIMITLFQLCIHKEWGYKDENDQKQAITPSTLDSLYVNGRIAEKDVQGFRGRWYPTRS